MTAGRGIAHTEESVLNQPDLHAAQLWIALPEADQHYPAPLRSLPDAPRWQQGEITSLCSSASTSSQRAPTLHFSPFWGWDLHAPAGEARSPLPLDPAFEHGLFPLRGDHRRRGGPGPGAAALPAPGNREVEC